MSHTAPFSFEIYKCSAGSGKTYTLVQSYLCLALKDAKDAKYFRCILAITFTNKAANEMKTRVVDALKMLAENEGKTTPLSQYLCEYLGIDADELQRRATNTLSAVLHNYSEFAISTIDSFVHRLVRSFARDLNFKQNFEIELDSNMLIEKSVDLLISQIGTNEKLSEVLVDFAKTKAENDTYWDVQRELEKFSRQLFQENSRPFVDVLNHYTPHDFEQVKTHLKNKINEFEQEIKENAAAAIDVLQQNNLSKNDFAQKEKGIGNFFYKILQQPDNEPNTYDLKAIYDDNWYSKANKNTDVAYRIEQVKHVLSYHFEAVRTLQAEQLPDYKLYVSLLKNLHALTVLSEINTQLKSYQESKNIVHISEFNHAISQSIADQPVPYIYERLGEKYSHFLIDEFQDTSILQWQNLLPLIENALAEQQYSMVVGDGKQAIYRFRGGEVEQLASLPRIYSPHLLTPAQQGYQHVLNDSSQELTLNTNYRSQREIVAFNNAFFDFCNLFLPENFKNIYENVAQAHLPKKQGGLVQIEFFDHETTTEAVCQRTLDTLYQLIEDGFRLSDIAILVRGIKEGNEVAQFLVSNGIDVISSDSLLLAAHRNVRFLVSLMRLLLDDTDTVAIAEVLYFIKNDLNQPTLTEQKIIELVQSRSLAQLEAACADLGFYLPTAAARKLPIYELTEQLVRSFNLHQQADAYIQGFLNLVLSFAQTENGNIHEFLDYWQEKSKNFTLTMPENAEAITLMTIHKSKGLQFPVVILPFADWETDKINANQYLWVNLTHNKDLAVQVALLPANQLQKTELADQFEEEQHKTILDNLNILYVALTRPEERLYIFSTQTKTATQTTVCKWLTEYLAMTGYYNEGQMVYQFGNADVFVPKISTSTSQDVRLEGFVSTDWNEKINLRSIAIKVAE
jgi:ATP-dependent exoDNAse (exonuclease V) beta subunit